MPKHLAPDPGEMDAQATESTISRGRHRRRIPNSPTALLHLLAVWNWLPAMLHRTGISATTKLRAAWCSSRLDRLKRGFASIGTAYDTSRKFLTDPATPTTLKQAVREHSTTALSTTRTGATTLARRTNYAWHASRGFLTDPATPTTVKQAVRSGSTTAWNVSVSAVKDPVGAWHKTRERGAYFFSQARTSLVADMDSSSLRRGIAGLGCAAIVSLAFIGTNTPDAAQTDSEISVASQEDVRDHAGRSDVRNENDPAVDPAQDRETQDDGTDSDNNGDAQEDGDSNGDAKQEEEANAGKQKPKPQPVAGLDQTQMNNAVTIVNVGKDMGLSRRGQAVALVTAMQETKLHNTASRVLPKSLDVDHEGVGDDHDSVGIFQQRPSMGWGSVSECMDVEYATTAFYKSLKKIDGWEKFPLTKAAQKVQGSAFPSAYAQWNDMAGEVLDEINK